MSADNTIHVFGTRRPGLAGGMEFRVAHTQGEELFGSCDYPSPSNAVFNREEVRRVFTGARIFFNQTEAMMEAVRMYEQCGYVEYGIVPSTFPNVYFPASDGRRRQRLRQREKQRAAAAPAPVAPPAPTPSVRKAPPLRPEAPAAPASPAS